MITFKNYVKAESIEEAYELAQKKSNIVLGGMVWVKMSSRNYNTAIDLCNLDLASIVENDDSFVIGAMTSLRDFEKNEALNKYTCGACADAVKSIVGVQFRNCATVGGSVYGRFGFSDVLTVLLALNAKVTLFGAGVMDLEDFIAMPRNKRDILVNIVVPKDVKGAKYLSQRLTATDFPMLTCAAVKTSDGYRITVGARPSVAVVVPDSKDLKAGVLSEDECRAFAEEAAKKLTFGSNQIASAEYRERIAAVLIRRALMGLQED